MIIEAGWLDVGGEVGELVEMVLGMGESESRSEGGEGMGEERWLGEYVEWRSGWGGWWRGAEAWWNGGMGRVKEMKMGA